MVESDLIWGSGFEGLAVGKKTLSRNPITGADMDMDVAINCAVLVHVMAVSKGFDNS